MLREPRGALRTVTAVTVVSALTVLAFAEARVAVVAVPALAVAALVVTPVGVRAEAATEAAPRTEVRTEPAAEGSTGSARESVTFAAPAEAVTTTARKRGRLVPAEGAGDLLE